MALSLPSNPEVDRLAGELCRQGCLDVFVRRYINKDRLWERFLLQIPGLKAPMASVFQHRPLPPGLTSDKVIDAGIVCDLMSAALLRTRTGLGTRAYWSLTARRDVEIARRANRTLSDCPIVVGNYGVAASVFERARRRGGHTVLNYPNAHHHYARRLLAEEAEREPEFASTITDNVSRLASVYDRECELADLILVGSSFVRETFRSENVSDKPIEVIPYGCNVSLFHPAACRKEGGTFRALFVGQISQRKGLSYLLKAARTVKGHGTEMLLVGNHVGNPATLKPYETTITHLSGLSHIALADVYKGADVFVFPTLLEGMPLVVLEAMASGLPVITTAHGPGDIVRDGVDGFIVPIRDSNAIVDKLDLLRREPELRIQMGKAARERALEFTWQAYCRQAARAVMEIAQPTALVAA